MEQNQVDKQVFEISDKDTQEKPKNEQNSLLNGVTKNNFGISNRTKCIIQYSLFFSILAVSTIMGFLIFQTQELRKFEDPEDHFIKYPSDLKKYEKFNLSNGMKVLIEKIQNQKSGDVGISVGINGLGGFTDPLDHQGTAHFLEHMIFTGSNQFEKNDYLDYIYQQQGEPNGLTSENITIYPTTVPYESNTLHTVMQRIADFIQNPILNNEIAKNEIFAVDSEYHNSLAETDGIIFNALSFLTDIYHPFNKFQVGNYETLKGYLEGDQQKLRQYFDKYYNPKNMVIVARCLEQDVEVVKKQIQETFKRVEQKTDERVTYNNYPDSMYNTTIKNTIMKIKTQSKVNQVLISFMTDIKPKQYEQYATIIKLFSNSLQEQVFDENLQLQTYNGQILMEGLGETQYLIGILFNIYPSEVRNFQKIINYIISKLNDSIQKTLQNKKVFLEYYEDFETAFDESFKEQEPQAIFNELIQHTEMFLQFPHNDFLYHPFKLDKFDGDTEEILENFLKTMNFKNHQILIRSNDFSQFAENSNTLQENWKEFQQKIQSNTGFEENLRYQFKFHLIKIDEIGKQFLFQEEIGEDNTNNNNSNNSNDSDQQKQNNLVYKSKLGKQQIGKLIQQLKSSGAYKFIKSAQQKQFISKITKQKSKQSGKIMKTQFQNNIPLQQLQPDIRFLQETQQDNQLDIEIIKEASWGKILFKQSEKYKSSNTYVSWTLKYPISTNEQNHNKDYVDLAILVTTFNRFIPGIASLNYETLSIDIVVSINTPEKLESIYQFFKSIKEWIFSEEIINNVPQVIKEYLNMQVESLNEGMQISTMQNIILKIFNGSKQNKIITEEQVLNLINVENYKITLDQNKFNSILIVTTSQYSSSQFNNQYKDLYLLPQLFSTDQTQFLLSNQEQKQHSILSKSQTNSVLRVLGKQYDKNNVAVANVYQINVLNQRDKNILQILQQFMMGNSFNHLRGIKKLGYVASTKLMNLNDNTSVIIVYVQGYRNTVNEIDKEIEAYLQVFEEYFNNFDENKNFENAYQQPENYYFNNILEEHMYIYSQFINVEQKQKQDEQEQQLEDDQNLPITKKEILNKYKQWFKGEEAIKLSIQVQNPFKSQQISQEKLSLDQSYSKKQTTIYSDINKFMNEKTNFYDITYKPYNNKLKQ